MMNVQEQDKELKQAVFTPAADIYEEKDSFTVLADMPGVEQKNIDISIEDNVLTISGTQNSQEHDGYELLHRGYKTGLYKRSFSLASDIDHAKISAKMNNGVLRLTLPKSEKAKPRKIEIES